MAVYHTESNQKYSTENLNSLLESLEKILNNSDDLFENEDIDHIVKSTQKNNFKPSGEVTEKLILDRLAIESVNVKGENEPLSQF
ncbi:hypothetical protein [Sinobaca sp. H24]|uniref:hypothetical protein n=1 Tax=Sinobaca sp. H24 TaxID=2923376 RepID=UPI002079AA1B|nr:hypothetical protein [Sinobaca sp. H24]